MLLSRPTFSSQSDRGMRHLGIPRFDTILVRAPLRIYWHNTGGFWIKKSDFAERMLHSSLACRAQHNDFQQILFALLIPLHTRVRGLGRWCSFQVLLHNVTVAAACCPSIFRWSAGRQTRGVGCRHRHVEKLLLSGLWCTVADPRGRFGVAAPLQKSVAPFLGAHRSRNRDKN